MTAAHTPSEFEDGLRSYYYESGEEARAVRVGEKDTSEQAAIVARYGNLFTSEQLAALRESEEAESDADEGERLYRLRNACESGFVASKLAPLQDALHNAELAAQVEFRGESLPLRTARARVSVVADYAEREELGTSAWDVSAGLNAQRLELLGAAEELQAELSGQSDPVTRSEEKKGVSLRRLAQVLSEASAATSSPYHDLRTIWLDRLLGPDREPHPLSLHGAYVHRLSALADIYTKERATAICLETLRDIGLDLDARPSIRTDLEDRPQKTPRPCVIAPDPPHIVHLITRPQAGLQDYAGFLHEAGHALHFAGCDPGLSYAFRALARDNALSEIYAFFCESVTREAGWHARFFDLTEEQAADHAEATRFLHSFMVRRFAAKLQFELGFWSRFAQDGGTAEGFVELLAEATGYAYRADTHLSDMDSGFYSADYLRGWIRSAQLRAYLIENIGEAWWQSPETGAFLASLFLEGTRPSNEEIAARIGFAADDVGPLIAELTAQPAASAPFSTLRP